MKLYEINNYVSQLKGSKEDVSDFFKKLYRHSVEVIESIPDDKIISILNQAEGSIYGVILSKTKFNPNTVYADFEQYDVLNNSIERLKRHEKTDDFDFGGFCVEIIFNEKAVKVQFMADFESVKYKRLYSFDKDEVLKDFFGDDLHSNNSDGSYIDFTLNVEYFTRKK